MSGAVDGVLSLPAGERIMVAFPLQASGRATHAQVVETLRAAGFLRVMADGAVIDLAASGSGDPARAGADLTVAREALVVVDRLAVSPGVRDRLAELTGSGLRPGPGEAVIVRPSAAPVNPACASQSASAARSTRTSNWPTRPRSSSPSTAPTAPAPPAQASARLSSTTRTSSCPTTGARWRAGRWTRGRSRATCANAPGCGSSPASAGSASASHGASLPGFFREEVLRGCPEFIGIIPFLRSRERQRRKQFIRVFLRRYQSAVPCAGCGGARIRAEALNVRVGGRTLPEVCAFPMDELLPWIDGLELSGMEEDIAETILREIRDRLGFLVDVGLGYLTLSRQTRTLSGGEAQRINLANALGSRLVDTLYVLDEPTVGLHPRDTAAMLALLQRLSHAGNTVVVVEHDPQVIVAADHVIELGPESGEKGGQVVFEGPPDGLADAGTATGRLIAGAANPRVARKRATRAAASNCAEPACTT